MKHKIHKHRRNMSIQLGAQAGAAIAIVRNDGSGKVDVWSIPENSVIDVTPAKGFGDATEVATGATKADAETAVDTVLTSDGAS